MTKQSQTRRPDPPAGLPIRRTRCYPRRVPWRGAFAPSSSDGSALFGCRRGLQVRGDIRRYSSELRRALCDRAVRARARSEDDRRGRGEPRRRCATRSTQSDDFSALTTSPLVGARRRRRRRSPRSPTSWSSTRPPRNFLGVLAAESPPRRSCPRSSARSATLAAQPSRRDHRRGHLGASADRRAGRSSSSSSSAAASAVTSRSTCTVDPVAARRARRPHRLAR